MDWPTDARRPQREAAPGCRARLYIQRMYTDGTIDIVVTIGQGFDVGGVVGADADAQEVPDVALPGRIQRGIQGTVVNGEVEAIKVTMGIYEHRKTATYIV